MTDVRISRPRAIALADIPAGTTPAAGMLRWNSGAVEVYNGSAWAAVGGGGGTPGGNDTTVQFNNSGSFGGSDDFIFTGSAIVLGSSGNSTTDIGFGNLNIDREVLAGFEVLVGVYANTVQKWIVDSDGWTTQAGTLTVDLPTGSADGYLEFKQDSVTHLYIDNNGLFTVTSKEYDSSNATMAIRSTWNTASSPSVLSLDITDTASGLTSAFLVGVYNTTEVINWRKDGQLKYTANVTEGSAGSGLDITANATGGATTTINGIRILANGDGVNTTETYGLYVIAQSGTTLNRAAYFGGGDVAVEYGNMFVSGDILVGNKVGAPAESIYIVRGLSTNMTGSSNYNVGVGVGVFGDLTDGSNCTAVGYQALTGVTTGYSNVGIGAQAGAGITTGLSNVCVGTYAGTAIVDGNSNVCVGDAAGQQLTSGGDNVLIGAGAGYGLTTDNKGIHIGFNAGYNETEGDHLYIDNRNRGTIPDHDRALALIFGTFADAVADQQITVNGVFETNAGRILNLTLVPSSINCDNTHHALKVTASGVTITLPTTPSDGREIRVLNRGGANCTVEAGGADTVEGSSSLVLADNESIIIIYDATNAVWNINADY